jgi:dTDP-4-amino-4,6-dideoxygalactose transaminase
LSFNESPALLGGVPIFEKPIPFVRPAIEEPQTILARIESSLETGMLTDGPLVRNLEEKMCEVLRVDHVVAVSSCTAGLTLVLQAVGSGKSVLLPSFTFSATAHAAKWNRMSIEFADCDPESWVLGSTDVTGSPDVIIGVHISGVPCDVAALEQRATQTNSVLVFDAAHGAGSLIDLNGDPTPLGSFGSAEVFSLTPTKVLSGPEGGLIATNDAGLADELKLARNYGNPGNYDTLTAGLNGRMSELHAAVVLSGIDHLERWVVHRNMIADHYREGLGEIPGLSFQVVPDGSRSSFKDFSILVADDFGVGRDQLVTALAAEGIPTRPYYSPPVHKQTAYGGLQSGPLPVTERLAAAVVSLPIWSHMDRGTADGVVRAIHRIHLSRDVF